MGWFNPYTYQKNETNSLVSQTNKQRETNKTTKKPVQSVQFQKLTRTNPIQSLCTHKGQKEQQKLITTNNPTEGVTLIKAHFIENIQALGSMHAPLRVSKTSRNSFRSYSRPSLAFNCAKVNTFEGSITPPWNICLFLCFHNSLTTAIQTQFRTTLTWTRAFSKLKCKK